MQQLSLLAPQLVSPSPPDWQLGGAVHAPAAQYAALLLQADPLTHAPLAHVCGVLLLHRVCVGPQTPPQTPPTQVVLVEQPDVDAT